MSHIDEKFKECDPKTTVDRIKEILSNLGIQITESWTDSGVEHCYSLNVYANHGVPYANGKGVTKDLARASAYGEFIERLQCGLFFYKNQSIRRGQDMDIHTYAPDGKYVTADELLTQGEWMDQIIEAYPELHITRQSIVDHCLAYACADDGTILVLPFYSLFENKYVYLPAAFVEQMYTANGCCAGNSRNEAWVHALSEILERYCQIKVLTSGNAAPAIPIERLRRFPTVTEILNQIEAAGDYDVTVFDYSQGIGIPVIATRIISRKTHKYRINVGADPVFEIAVQRTLTEMFQGLNLDNLADRSNERILSNTSDFPAKYNINRQLENGTGYYCAKYFANALTCKESPSSFADNSNKNNQELLELVLGVFRKLKRQIYIRNYSFTGFNTYKIVVPGMSETRSNYLEDILPEYSIGDEVSKTLRNPALAQNEDLQMLLSYSNVRSAFPSMNNSYRRMAGPPLSLAVDRWLVQTIRAYAAYKLGRMDACFNYLSQAIARCAEGSEVGEYLNCVRKFIELTMLGIDPKYVREIIYKFYHLQYAEKLYGLLDQDKTPFEEYLIHCDYSNCSHCKYREYCSYQGVQEMIRNVGKLYSRFTDGQNPDNFKI